MKNTVKLIIIMIFIILITFVTNVYAVEGTVGVSISKTSVYANDTFVVTISAKSPAGLNGVNFMYEYDNNELELVSQGVVDASWSNIGGVEGEISLLTSSIEDITEANVYQFTFKVKENATPKTTNIKLKNIMVSTNSSGDDADFPVNDLSISTTIKDKNVNPPEVPKNEVENNITGNVIDGNQNNNVINETNENRNNTVNEVTGGNNNVITNEIRNIVIGNEINDVNDEVTSGINNTTNENNVDNTLATNKIPQTGSAYYITIGAIILAIVTIISYIGYKKYKEVK